jgi:hypothetical protein
MVMYDLYIYVYIPKYNMPCCNLITCHNFEPSLIIIMNDGDQYFERI